MCMQYALLGLYLKFLLPDLRIRCFSFSYQCYPCSSYKRDCCFPGRLQVQQIICLSSLLLRGSQGRLNDVMQELFFFFAVNFFPSICLMCYSSQIGGLLFASMPHEAFSSSSQMSTTNMISKGSFSLVFSVYSCTCVFLRKYAR